MPSADPVEAHLHTALTPLALRAGRDVVRRLGDAVRSTPEGPLARRLAQVVVQRSAAWEDLQQRAEADLQVLRAGVASGRAAGAAADVASRWPLGAGRAARSRWFDASALEDRLLRARHGADQDWAFAARALAASDLDGVDGPLGDEVVRGATLVLTRRTAAWWLRVEAARVLGGVVRRTPRAHPGTPALLRRLGRRRSEDPFVQAACLEAWAAAAPPEEVHETLRWLLEGDDLADAAPDHVFARARALTLAADVSAWPLLERVATGDASEHVRFAAAHTLARCPDDAVVGRVLAGLADPGQERAALACARALLRTPEGWRRVGAALAAADVAPARALIDHALGIVLAPAVDPQVGDAVAETWDEAAAAHRTSADEDLSRLGDVLQAWCRLWRAPTTRAAWRELAAWATAHDEGAGQRFGPATALGRLGEADALEVLYVVAHEDLDLSARPLGARRERAAPSKGWWVRLGLAQRRTAWRWWHEVTHPRHDKRQAHPHTVDDVPDGPLVAWSGRLAEVVATEVPGRRVATPRTSSWHEHLPLPANLLTALRFGEAVVRTPRGPVRIRPVATSARWKAHRRYVALADRRARLTDMAADEAMPAWDAELADTGFEVSRSPTWALGPLGWLGAAGGTGGYAVGEILALGLGALGFFQLVKLARDTRLGAWRREVPLVVGGWGSRGKSSVERLKSAMFHGMGYRVLCKSTGCEAMILSAIPGSEAVEIFLYRPRDKATIVEQANVLELAARMKPQVLLWECMALNPIYTGILQHQWMRDDLTTVTNTYPDHEDIQGPSGRDVADTIGEFVPIGGSLVTSEHHMTPVLQRRARRQGTPCEALRPLDWTLVPRDLLARFPYVAYDRNVALVGALGTQLGIPFDEALRAMADHVLLDLGAFKRYGPIDVEGREVSFVNGMSANDRASFLSNWERARLDDVPDDSGTGQWLIVILNNRADRLARQAMFARIAALDIAADRLAIIGTNVVPMRDAILKAYEDELVPRLRQEAGSEGGRSALKATFARRLRRPTNAAAAVAPMGLGEGGADAIAAWEDDVQWLASLSGDTWDVEAAIAAFVARLAARLRPLPDPTMSGDAVLGALAAQAPVGSAVTLLGCENIKGTGLDFVYRWVSIDRVRGWLDALEAPERPEARRALEALAAYDGWGLHDARLAATTLERLVRDGTFAAVGRAEDAEAALATAEAAVAAKLSGASTKKKATGLAKWLGPWAKDLDLVGSIRRRALSERLYRDLGAGTVGRARAAVVAADLVDGEKG